MKVGCQTWRKTGYCSAISGEVNRNGLKISVWHSKKSKSAPSYSKHAAGGSYQIQKQNPDNLHFLRDWTNIVVQNTGNAEIRESLSGSRYYREIKNLPEFFVRKCLGNRA
jgi:hypothetical protein